MADSNKISYDYTTNSEPTEYLEYKNSLPPSYESVCKDNTLNNYEENLIIIKEKSYINTGLIFSGVFLGCAIIFPPKAIIFTGLSLATMTLTLI